jgi:excisionase family DNA binding protein
MPDRTDNGPPTLTIPDALLDALADAVADRLARRLPHPDKEPASPWMDFEAARAYLGFSQDALYKLTAAGAIPCRRKAGGQGLRFHRGELDAWMEEAYPRVDRLAR